MSRQTERGVVVVLSFVVAGLLIYLGMEKGWRISFFPAEYVGYLVAALGGLSLAGVNVWFHGDLDPKKDAAAEAERRGGGV